MVGSLRDDTTEDYELLPKQEVDNLKKELERLKKHPFGDLSEGKDILEAVNNLNSSIKKLIDIFTKAEADLAKEYGEQSPAGVLNDIKDQNEQIAQGLVAVADMVKEMKDENVPMAPGSRIPIMQPRRGPESYNMQSSGPSPYPQQDFGVPPPPQPFPGLGEQGSFSMPEAPPFNDEITAQPRHKPLFSRR